MRLTAVTRAAGTKLARDLPPVGAGTLPLLRAGAELTERFCASLTQHGIHAVWVDDELSAGIEPVEIIPAALRHEAAQTSKAAVEAARAALAAKQPLSDATLRSLSDVVGRISDMVRGTPDAALALTDLAAADQYTHQHSVNVCALGLLLGGEIFRRHGWIDWDGRARFDRVEDRLAKLGLGLLLHDIGKLVVPSEVLNKPGKLDEAEWKLMRSHPEVGVSLLRSDTISALVKAVVRDHHERWDGTGYPRGIVGTDINELARIAAVADVYDAVTSERPYKEAAPAHVGVQVILDGDGTAFDPGIVKVFRTMVFPYPVGTELRLADGSLGVVAGVDPQRPEVPVVRLLRDGHVVEVAVDTTREEVTAGAHRD